VSEVERTACSDVSLYVPAEPLSLSCRADDATKPSVVGWERNSSGKLAPKLADLGPLMDPLRLADQAVDLNLKLMRWRILPEINLEKIQSTRCLLLGAGTLGCYVARTLLGWGVRKITFVDSSTVSFSNPVRQPLFEYKDSLEGGKPKAQCAADSIKRIYPGVESAGHQINIPMPGHPIPPASVKQTQTDVALLESLIDDHDVVYLLMDSRESRWLPTVIGSAKGKLVMNTALGFDTFLAMRHGANPTQHRQKPESTRLGCYFCNDIVAPTDSLTDRTLDQMCTVTRPGIAAIASAMSVELMVSILQHPDGILAGAYSNTSPEASILGHLPHQLRGSLFNFSTLLIQGPAYDKCTGCSETVLSQYEQRGFQMVQEACNDENYLRSLTGLDKLYDATDDIEVEWSEDEGEEGEGELL
jgi:ubiquitin-like modifier-activating enzyme ATG7